MPKGFIDLGKKADPMGAISPKPDKAPKIHYPSCYISDVEGLDVEDGDEVILRGKVTSVTTTSRGGKKGYSCDVEVNSLKVDGESLKAGSAKGLDDALDDISKEKEAEMDPDTEEENDE